MNSSNWNQVRLLRRPKLVEGHKVPDLIGAGSGYKVEGHKVQSTLQCNNYIFKILFHYNAKSKKFETG